MDNQITWINTQGQETIVTVKPDSYTVHVAGKRVADVMSFSSV